MRADDFKMVDYLQWLKESKKILIVPKNKFKFFMDISKVTTFEFMKGDGIFIIKPEDFEKDKDDIMRLLGKHRCVIL